MNLSPALLSTPKVIDSSLLVPSTGSCGVRSVKDASVSPRLANCVQYALSPKKVTVGNYQLTHSQEQLHGESRPVIIPMKFSKAFLIYDDASQSIRLFEEGDKRTQSQPCQMRCGIVGPQDDQLLYVKDTGKRNNRHYTLMRRSINVEVKGNSRSRTLGQERKACELGLLKYHKDAKLKMAFSRADSSSSLIVSSSD